MKSIIVYNSMTGNTKELAYKIKEVLKSNGHQVEIYRDDKIYLKVRNNLEFFKLYDLLCFGSCTHALSPAFSFQTFLNRVKKHNLKNKMLLCFATSATQGGWKITCQKVKKMFPELHHLGDIGCTQRNCENAIEMLKLKLRDV
jgi:flavodoxin